MKKTIKHQFFFQHPPAVVWEYLTKSELMEQWLMKNNFRPVIGFDFQFTTGPIPSLDFDGIFYCKVLVIEPLQKLSYSWQSGPGGGKITLESIVDWQLVATEKGTELYLEHSGFEKDENLNFFNGLNHGWIEKFHKIEQLINAKEYGSTGA